MQTAEQVIDSRAFSDFCSISSPEEVPDGVQYKEHKRDPEAHPVKKGNEWKFGYKAHVGVDSNSGQYKAKKKEQ